MTQNQVQQEISIIKEMIDKTRKETAESGHLFIFMGIASAFFVLIISLLEMYRVDHLVIPAMIILTCLNGLVGYFVVSKPVKEEKVQSYPKTVVLSLWVVCGVTLLMITFLFPFLKVYTFRALGTLASLILGIAVFMTGVIYEMRFVVWYSLAWWVGAVLMAISDSPYRFLIMIAVIFIAWIVPGFIMNKKYKNRSEKNEA
ncbi:hypothetical protein H8E88_14425 [candidate division KSB1 bacterium]|nr:hypothetical protein [candidate division KSB1 bacterium]MBL7094818.1 hypothetical protein [candidate division KSB1 bacterium]